MIESRSQWCAALALCFAGCSSHPTVATSADSRRTPDASASAISSAGSRPDTAASQKPAPATFAAALALNSDSFQAMTERQIDVFLSQAQRQAANRAALTGHPRVGDVVLVDVSSYDDAQRLTERVNTFGVLQSRVGDQWSVRDARTHKTISVRLREDSWMRAPKGAYRLRTTGDTVATPDYYVHIERYASLPVSGRIVGQSIHH